MTAFLLKVRWIRRRAKRLKAFYGLTRQMAVFDAHMDWINFSFATTPLSRGDSHDKTH